MAQDHVTSLTYPSTFSMSGTDNESLSGYKYYGKDGTNYFNFAGAEPTDINFQVHPQTDPYTRPLIVHLADYDNDVSLVYEYFTTWYPDTSIMHVSGHRKYVRTSTYELLDDIDLGGGKTFHADQAVGFDIPLVGESQLPYNTVRYFPSDVQYIYQPYGNVTIGDEALGLGVSGTFFYNAEGTPGLNPVSDIKGEMKYSDISAHYRYEGLSGTTINSQEELDKLMEGVTEQGNGNNPFPGPLDPSNNPFENNPSRTGGGKGKYEKQGDKTGKPGLPTSGVLQSGFIAMYAPTSGQLQTLGAKLWSDDFFDTFIKLWNDPMEAIISLGLVPFTPPSTGSTAVYIGNYNTEMTMPRVTSQYITLSCGSVSLSEYWGSALDYGPYTEAEIFLPFVGMRKIDIDDVMGKTVSVDYNVDLLGGEAVCYVTVDDVVLYDFKCNLQTNIPISSSSYASLYSGILKGVSGAALGAAAGGAMGAATGALTSAVNVITTKHSTIERGSEMSPNAGALGLLTPYLIIHRVVQSLPTGFNRFKGYPSNVTRTLGSLSGYVQVEYCHLEGIPATDNELAEIESYLKSGVII